MPKNENNILQKKKKKVSYSVSIACFNMNGSEWALKMQPDIY